MPLIAMTREMGSLGKDVAAGVAQRSGRKVIYQELVEPIANKMRLRKSHVERFLEGKSGIWERLTTDKTSLSIFTADETLRFLRDGSTAVIRGWGAVHLLRSVPHVIRVRVCAPLELRVTRMMERLGTDNREAVEDEIRLSEEAHTAITRRHFGVNWRDAENYDLVLNTERMSVDECIAEVDQAMAMPRFQETPRSQMLVADLATVWAARSALRRDPRTTALDVAIDCLDGVVRMSGRVETALEIEAAREILAALPGVQGIEERLQASHMANARPARRSEWAHE